MKNLWNERSEEATTTSWERSSKAGCVRSPRNRWTEWTAELLLLLQRIFLGEMRLDGPGPATLSWLSLVKAARGRVAKSHLGMYFGMAGSVRSMLMGFGRSGSRGGGECRHVPLTSLAFL